MPPIPCLVIALALASGQPLSAQGGAPTETETAEETTMTVRAKGSFEVKLSPLSLHHESADPLLGRMSLDKEFHGDLAATSTGEMLSARTGTEGSAGYVAIEHVSGRLNGRSGNFVLQHSSTMLRGAPQQSITVVPDSATGELEGLTGSMTIEITEGQHLYVFDYSLPSG